MQTLFHNAATVLAFLYLCTALLALLGDAHDDHHNLMMGLLLGLGTLFSVGWLIFAIINAL